ncbi:SCO family protein [Flavobacterium azooxidireducens]|uniref:SCO family protein n=1 Tax=Flavobacterium azooxidireducens TaxID=1871076 RepID=A0ABY4KIQ4_9FLAO|nr:SCO family protein [Flavobacterium azooxidireducens]UPQ80671.1 SCO family protein [Flavobacterium azooxidireducens]
MLSYIKQYKFRILGFILFSAIFLSISIYLLTPNKKLPIFNPSDVNPELVDSTVQHVSKYHTIADFSFTNQNGEIISQKNYEGKIYVADFFFTTCPTICPIMQDNMVEIQNAFKDVSDVMLLSHTVMPHIDSVPVLKKYAIEKGVIDSKWNLVTGDKKDIFYIARKSYLAVKTETEGELYDMVHTENFILVDKKRRVRGFYDGTNKEEIKRLIEDIRFLMTEKN